LQWGLIMTSNVRAELTPLPPPSRHSCHHLRGAGPHRQSLDSTPTVTENIHVSWTQFNCFYSCAFCVAESQLAASAFFMLNPFAISRRGHHDRSRLCLPAHLLRWSALDGCFARLRYYVAVRCARESLASPTNQRSAGSPARPAAYLLSHTGVRASDNCHAVQK